MIMHIGFRIKQAIGLTGYNVKEFCEHTGRSRITTTLWINSRGGVIKDQSLEELCLHLRQCGVFCCIKWLKWGTGASPQLILEKEDNVVLPPIKFETLQLNYEQIFLLLSQLDNDYYFEYTNSKFLLIAASISPTIISKYHARPIIVHTLNEVVIGTLSHFCKKSETLIVNTFENATQCISIGHIQKMGAILFLMDKRINKIS